MLVNKSNFHDSLKKILSEVTAHPFIATDTETTALFWWKSPHYDIEPRVFSIQFSTEKSDYYFDFGCQETYFPDSDCLGQEHFDILNTLLFSLPELTWFIHNAKFDMHHLANHGVSFAGTVHCTQAIQRVVNNLEDGRLSLDSLSEKYLGANKIDLSEYWKPEGGRVTVVPRPGSSGRVYDFLHFDRLPLDILVKYGERDTRLCYQLGMLQLAEIKRQNELYFGAVPSNFGGSLFRVLDNERELTKTMFRMERVGVQLDIDYVKRALAYDEAERDKALSELNDHAAPYLVTQPPGARIDWNSGKQLEEFFNFMGIPYSYTEKGNASFDSDALEKANSPITKRLLDYRYHAKRATTYFENFLWLADRDGVLHCTFAQGGPETGRVSCREPNLQNVPKRADKDESNFPVRRCFKPRPGKLFADLDYDQVEYRLMLDYARERALIDRILKDGLDVHEATQQELSLESRDDAKTMNFMLLYGGGVAKLAAALFKDVTLNKTAMQAIWFLYKWPHWKKRDGYLKDSELVASLDKKQVAHHLERLKQAEAKLNHYFEKLPNVQEFIAGVKEKAKKKGVIFTWLGRVLRYGKDSKGKNTDYKAPNGLIQGGAGDVSKVACNRVQRLIDDKFPGKMDLLLQVHDALLLELDDVPECKQALPEIAALMAACYPHRLIPLTSGCAWSKKSWGDLEEGLPL